MVILVDPGNVSCCTSKVSAFPGGVYLIIVKRKVGVVKTEGNEALFVCGEFSLVVAHSLVVVWEA